MAKQRKARRPMTRLEVELAAMKVGITRNEIWLVKTPEVLRLIAGRVYASD